MTITTTATSDVNYEITWEEDKIYPMYNSNTSSNKIYLKGYPNSYYTGEVFGGTYTPPIVAPPKSIKDELIDLLRYDYELRNVVKDFMRAELVDALQNDYNVRQILDRMATSKYWQQEFIESVMMALETRRTQGEHDDFAMERYNNILIPIHKAKESVNDRAVKLV